MASTDITRTTEAHVQERNRRVETAFLKSYPTISVFCVSSKHYRSNVAGYRLDQNDAFPLGVDISGKPDLKRFVANLDAPRRQGELSHYIDTTIPNLVNSVAMVSGEPTTTSPIVIPGGLEMHLKVRPLKAWQIVLTT